MESKYFLAVDIGASSGRHIVGWELDGEIKTEEVYRFYNGVDEEGGHLVWNVGRLAKEVIEGVKIAFSKYKIESLAIDTWGVDYVLMNGEEPILPCYAYRDARTERSIDKVHAVVPFGELYAKTGIQYAPYNTIYQLYDDKLQGRLEGATDFLMMPEYLTWVLTGVKAHEYTESSTSGLVNARTCKYNEEIIEKLGLPKRLFASISQPGTPVGGLKPEIANYVHGQTEVVLCASHDTGSAVEGIPMEEDQLFLSSGTWSLLGARLKQPITTVESMQANYANEGGVGYIRYLKNIMGMWVVNNLKKELCSELDFATIIQLARDSEFNGTVDVNAPVFMAPKSMVKAFDGCFREGNKPQTIGDYFKCAFVSLAVCYNKAIKGIGAITGKEYSKLYIVGGGAKNDYLNELTASLCGVEVVALPIEATAIGNLRVQIKRKENR